MSAGPALERRMCIAAPVETVPESVCVYTSKWMSLDRKILSEQRESNLPGRRDERVNLAALSKRGAYSGIQI